MTYCRSMQWDQFHLWQFTSSTHWNSAMCDCNVLCWCPYFEHVWFVSTRILFSIWRSWLAVCYVCRKNHFGGCHSYSSGGGQLNCLHFLGCKEGPWLQLPWSLPIFCYHGAHGVFTNSGWMALLWFPLSIYIIFIKILFYCGGFWVHHLITYLLMLNYASY